MFSVSLVTVVPAELYLPTLPSAASAARPFQVCLAPRNACPIESFWSSSVLCTPPSRSASSRNAAKSISRSWSYSLTTSPLKSGPLPAQSRYSGRNCSKKSSPILLSSSSSSEVLTSPVPSSFCLASSNLPLRSSAAFAFSCRAEKPPSVIDSKRAPPMGLAMVMAVSAMLPALSTSQLPASETLSPIHSPASSTAPPTASPIAEPAL